MAMRRRAAHAAISWTNGGPPRWPRTAGKQRGIVRVAGGDQHVAHEARPAEPLDRAAGKQRPEAGVVEDEPGGEAGREEVVAGAQLGLARHLRPLVPRAHREAVVAAVDPVADRRPEFLRDRPLVLDRQVRDAAPRVEPIGRREGVGRAGLEAGAAGAAMVLLRRVRLQGQGGEHRAEEQPRAVAARDEVGVLALPAEPRRLRQRLLHDRRGVDEHLHLAAHLAAIAPSPREPAGQLLELALDHVVVVAVAGVDGDVGRAPVTERRERIAGRPVVHAEHDDRPHVRPQHAGVGAARLGGGQPVHVAGAAGLQERAQTLRGLRDRVRRGDPAQVEAQRLGACREAGLQGACVRGSGQKSRSA